MASILPFVRNTATALNCKTLYRPVAIISQRLHTSTTNEMAANLNSENISKITDAEKKLTGQDEPVKGGPTAKAQSHAGEPINSQTLHDITEGEKKVTGGDRVAGGPTAIAQSILTKVCFIQCFFLLAMTLIIHRATKRALKITPANSTPIRFQKLLRLKKRLLVPMDLRKVDRPRKLSLMLERTLEVEICIILRKERRR